MLSCALVLTARPGSGAIRDAHAEEIWSRLPRSSAVGRRWLSPDGDAWEASVLADAAVEAEALRAVAEEVVEGLPVDVNLVADAPGGAGRKKQLLCADMESTIIAQEMLDEMADLVGCRAEIASITEAAMRGDLDFEAALRHRVALFAGVDAARLEPLHPRITPMPGAETLVRTLRTSGCVTALVTGGFTFFAEPVADRLGFDIVVANVLEVADGRLTGRVVPPVIGPDGKAATLERLRRERGLAAADTLAVGDGANDALMLAAAGLGVAFRAKPKLAEQARARPNGAVVRHGDLTALLYLQGYAREEFAG